MGPGGGPGMAAPGGRPGMGPGGANFQSAAPPDDLDSSLMELAVYGEISLYERYPPKPPAAETPAAAKK